MKVKNKGRNWCHYMKNYRPSPNRPPDQAGWRKNARDNTEKPKMSQQQRSPFVTKLAPVLYPFTTAAVAVNLFMLSLAWQRIGLPALAPTTALLLSLGLGVPVNWLVVRWVRRLIDEADS